MEPSIQPDSLDQSSEPSRTRKDPPSHPTLDELRQAASILHIPTETLSVALLSRNISSDPDITHARNNSWGLSGTHASQRLHNVTRPVSQLNVDFLENLDDESNINSLFLSTDDPFQNIVSFEHVRTSFHSEIEEPQSSSKATNSPLSTNNASIRHEVPNLTYDTADITPFHLYIPSGGIPREDLLNEPFSSNNIDHAGSTHTLAHTHSLSEETLPSPSTLQALPRISARPPPNTFLNRTNGPTKIDAAILPTVILGPCSKVWALPAKPQRGGRKRRGVSKRKGAIETHQLRRPRGPFQDLVTREQTAVTRKLKACIRCHLQKIRCEYDPNDPHGPCLTCIHVLGRTSYGLPCLRYKITDASLFRDQKAPNYIWTRRWNSMEISDISGWASSATKTIELTHGFGDAKYKLRIREFIPLDGDMLYEAWYDGSTFKKHDIPPYAIENMHEVATELKRYVDNSTVPFMIGTLGESDPLIWETYQIAWKYSWNSPNKDEKRLLRNVLRLWVTSRMTSMAESICSDEKFGTKVTDESSPYYGNYPVAPLICAQLEIITFSTLQRPLKDRVLEGLESMIKKNDRANWFTVYLVLFILLHSCALTTKRDEEYARQMNAHTTFFNPESISAHHMGMLTMLGYFHYSNKNTRPLSLAADESTRGELSSVGLNNEQIKFLARTSHWVAKRRLNMDHVRDQRAFSHEFYFVSQLYDEKWEPGPIG